MCTTVIINVSYRIWKNIYKKGKKNKKENEKVENRKLRKVRNLKNLGKVIPSFLISEFPILLYSQNLYWKLWKVGNLGNLGKVIPSFRFCPTAKLRFKNLGKNFRDFGGFPVSDLVLYFKDMPNSIDFYKRIFLHVIPVRIIVPW